MITAMQINNFDGKVWSYITRLKALKYRFNEAQCVIHVFVTNKQKVDQLAKLMTYLSKRNMQYSITTF